MIFSPSEDLIINRIKMEYQMMDLVMSELLRSYERFMISTRAKKHLLEWAGEDDLMMIDDDGNIVCKNKTIVPKNQIIIDIDVEDDNGTKTGGIHEYYEQTEKTFKTLECMEKEKR